MRILALNCRDSLSPQAGGSEIHLHEVLRRFVDWGHDVTLICSQWASCPGPSRERVDGVRTIRVGAWWNAHLTVPRAAKALLKTERFDVLLDDVNKIPFFAPRWSPIPVVALFHHLLGQTVFIETNPAFAAALWLYERRVGTVYRNTPSIAVSRSTATEMTHRGVRPDRVTVIEPGLNHALYRPDVCPKDPDPLLLVVSRLKRYKRVDVAIRASAEVRTLLPKARLVIVGSGEERSRLERLARNLRQPVEFTGSVSNDEKVRWMNRACIVLNPSEKEGWGLVGLEAMACGTPVVASDVPGHRDSVPRGVGVLVPKGDPCALAVGALELLSDADRHQHATKAGIAWAAKFSWEEVARRIEDEILSACAAQSVSSAQGNTERRGTDTGRIAMGEGR